VVSRRQGRKKEQRRMDAESASGRTDLTLVASRRPREMPSFGMDSRQPNPTRAGGKNSIWINQVRVGIRVNRIKNPNRVLLLHWFMPPASPRESTWPPRPIQSHGCRREPLLYKGHSCPLEDTRGRCCLLIGSYDRYDKQVPKRGNERHLQ
jgi:hypothetical protein